MKKSKSEIFVFNNIQQYRLQKNINQEELAQALDVTRTYLSKLENQKFAPSADLMYKICKYFGVGIGEMFYIN